MGNQQNPKNKVKMCEWCEWRPAIEGSNICLECDKIDLFALLGKERKEKTEPD